MLAVQVAAEMPEQAHTWQGRAPPGPFPRVPATEKTRRLVKSGHMDKSSRLDKKREEMSLIFL